jgi:hypothetical protein
VIDGMMDAPMHDVVASLPLAEDVREALVQRRGLKGQLLDCVAALETGEDGPSSGFVANAGELYLEALMWANTAAESLFGEPGTARPQASSMRAAANGRRPVLAEPAGSKPPPGSVPSAVPVPATAESAGSPATAPVALDGPGRPAVVVGDTVRPSRSWFGRAWARFLVLFGRRAGEARG